MRESYRDGVLTFYLEKKSDFQKFERVIRERSVNKHRVVLVKDWWKHD